MRSKATLLLVLSMSIVSLVGCRVDDDPEEVFDSKQCRMSDGSAGTATYFFSVGTAGSGLNPAGGVFIKLADGSVQPLKNKSISAEAGGTMVLKNGQSISFGNQKNVTTDSNGDFYIDKFIERTTHQFITSIKSATATFKIVHEGAVYKKTYSYSTETVWDQISGVSAAVGDLKISQSSVSSNTATCDLRYWRKYDIDGDIILELSETGYKAPNAKVNASLRSSGKEVREKSSGGGAQKASRGSAQ